MTWFPENHEIIIFSIAWAIIVDQNKTPKYFKTEPLIDRMLRIDKGRALSYLKVKSVALQIPSKLNIENQSPQFSLFKYLLRTLDW